MHFYYAPNFEEVEGAYWFRVVRLSGRQKPMHARVLKFHIWIPHGKIFDICFFFLSDLYLIIFKKKKILFHLIFLELWPFENLGFLAHLSRRLIGELIV